MIFPKEAGFCRFFLDTLVRGGDIPVTDAPDSFVLAGALYTLATTVLDKTTFPHAGTLLTPTFAGVLVAPPERYRRSTVIHLATRVVEEFEEVSKRDRRGPDDFSADALIEHMGQGVEYQNVGLTFATDFESFLFGGQAWNDRARGVLCSLLDGRGEFRAARAKTQLVRIERPRLAILTALDPRVLADLPKARREFANGLMARLLPVLPADAEGFEVGLGYAPPEVDCPRPAAAADITKAAELLHERWKATTAFEGWALDAKSVYIEWRHAHLAWVKENQELKHGLYGDALGALPAHVLRLACLYQVDIDPEATEVTRGALEYAMELARVVRHGITQLGSPRSAMVPINTGEAALGQVLRALHALALQANGVYAPVSGARVYNAVRLSKKAIDEAIDELEVREIAVRKNKGVGHQIQFLHSPAVVLARLLGRPEKSEVVPLPAAAMNAVLRVLHDLTVGGDAGEYDPIFLSNLIKQSGLSEEVVTAGVRELAWNEIIEVVRVGAGRRLRIVSVPEEVRARIAAGGDAVEVSGEPLPSPAARLQLVAPSPPAPQSQEAQSPGIYASDEEYAEDVRAWELEQHDKP